MVNIEIEPGTYVVAVSGGVDSVALLDLLVQQPDLKLVVAHYDHGIRYNSEEDRKLVQQMATQHGLPFVYDEGNLGDISEATARKARYDFLYKVQMASAARAIITAHHQDDVLETAILNLLRGTGRKGLTALKSTDAIKRPLLRMPKQDLIHYAKERGLVWHEDVTNQDLKYLRNYIRHKIVPKFSPLQRQSMLGIINSLKETNEAIDQHLVNHLHMHPAIDKLDRHTFIMLPHVVAREVMLTWLRRHDVRNISSRSLERLVVAAKTRLSDQQIDVDKNYNLNIDNRFLALTLRDR